MIKDIHNNEDIKKISQSKFISKTVASKYIIKSIKDVSETSSYTKGQKKSLIHLWQTKMKTKVRTSNFSVS